jgi:hypothetical protein
MNQTRRVRWPKHAARILEKRDAYMYKERDD